METIFWLLSPQGLMEAVRTGFWFGLCVGFIAFIHEFGHFSIAKLCGVRVDEFSLGFGKLLWGRKVGETEYSLRLLPFIAYVRPAGMDPEEEYPPGEDPGERGFQAKGFWAKQAILVGGPLFNFLATMAILTGIFWCLGVPKTTIKVGGVLEGRPAMEAGILKGDVVTHMDGVMVEDRDAAIEYIAARNGKPIRFRLRRAGGESGSEPTSVELSVVPVAGPGEPARIGIQADVAILEEMGRATLPLGESIRRAGTTTAGYVIKIYSATVGIILQAMGRMEVPKEVSGPVRIVAVISKESKTGLENMLFFTAGLSLSIGVFNLLPVPALDGGRMLLLLVALLGTWAGRLFEREDLADGSLVARVEGYVNALGFLFLIGLMLAVTFKDVRELVAPAPPPSTAPATAPPPASPRSP